MGMYFDSTVISMLVWSLIGFGVVAVLGAPLFRGRK